MGTITGSIGSAGSTTYLNQVRYLNCSCPAGYYPTQITFNDIKSGGAYWKNNSSSSKILDIHLVNSAGTLLVANLMRISLGGNGTDSSTKTTITFDASGYVGQGIYIIGGNATGNIYLQNGTSVTVTTAPISYSLTTSAGTGGSLSASPAGSVATGTTVTLTPSASTGYTFSGYTTSPSVTITNNKFTMPASNLTVTANFTHNSYTLSKAVSPSGGGSVTLGATSGYYGSVINISASANTGYAFSSWSTTGGTIANKNSASTTITMPNGNATVTANFTHVTRYLSSAVSPSGGGTVTLGASSGYYGSVINISATPSTGYAFNKWTTTGGTLGNANASSTTITMPNANATVTADFTHLQYTITKVAVGGEINTSPYSGYYNETVYIGAVPYTGYEFVEWQTTGGTLADPTSENTTITLPASNITLTAVFAKIDYTITTAVSPSGSGTLVADSATANYGDTVTLTETPAAGYEFVDYTTDPGLTIENDQFTMPAENVSITANFKLAAIPSVPSLDKTDYTGGDTAELTIEELSEDVTHRYRLRFRDGMDTGWVNVDAGETEVDIYIPIEWCMHTLNSMAVSGGVLTLETITEGVVVGGHEITGITYHVKDGTIPRLKVWRCDANGNASVEGTYAKYAVTVQESANSFSLTYGQTTAQNIALTGDILPNDKKSMVISANHMVTLTVSIGSETISLVRDVPKVVKIRKSFLRGE